LILIIYYSVARWEEERITDALRRMGVAFEMVDVSREPIEVGGSLWSRYQVAIQRSVSRSAALESSAALEGSGVRVINSSISTAISQSKIWCLSILSRSGIPVPRSYASFGAEAVRRSAEIIGYPLIYKPSQGSWGRLISMARDSGELIAITSHREAIGSQAIYGLVQEYVRKPGRDIRATVIGEEVITIYRVNKRHWITNTARGAEAAPAPRDPELIEISIKAVKALGLEIAGIDIFEHPEKGYVVNEANPVPEFKNVARVTGIDVGRLIAEYAVAQLRR
jgi:Lysine biosynthesis enzyme LysX